MPGINVNEFLKASDTQIIPKALLTSFSNPTELDVCTQTLANTLNYFATNSSSIGEIIQYSGRGMNDLGDYDSCRRLPEKYYLLVNLVLSGFMMNFGLCLPNNCSYGYMTSKTTYFKELISDIVGVNLDSIYLSMIDSAEMSKTLNQVTKGPVITLLGIGLVILIVLVSTVMDYKEYFKENKKGVVSSLLWCFSLKRNIKGVLSTTNRVDPNLEVFNGIRVLSIAWIVVSHSFYVIIFVPFTNADQALNDMIYATFLTIVKCGTIAVDIFFFLSGFLAALSLYRSFKIPDRRNAKCFVMTYFHRYVRLLPFLLLIMVYTIYIQPLLADGPMSYAADDLREPCLDQWYQVLLYYVNFSATFDQFCMGWIWYIIVDMQLFIFLPALIIIYCLNKKVFYSFMVLFSMITLVVPLVLSFYYRFNISNVKTDNNAKYDSGTVIYIKPYCRGLAYCLGIILFVLYNEGNKEPEKRGISGIIKDAVYNKRAVRYALYTIGVVIMLIVVYSFYFLDAYPDKWNDAFGALHIALVRPIFIIGLGLMMYPVLIGRGKNLLSILGYYVFNPLAKLTYGVYMIHLPVFFYLWISTLQAEYYSISDRIITSVMLLIFCYLISFICTLIFESPIVQLLKLLVDSESPKSNSVKVLK